MAAGIYTDFWLNLGEDFYFVFYLYVRTQGRPIDKELLNASLMHTIPKSNASETALPKLRTKNHYTRPRPKTIHIDVGRDLKDAGGDGNMVNFNLSKKGSSMNLAGMYMFRGVSKVEGSRKWWENGW